MTTTGVPAVGDSTTGAFPWGVYANSWRCI